jgi:hypothetical protein
MGKMFVKPAPGLKVRLPDNPRAFLPDEGAEVERDSFWMRRLFDADVVIADAPKKSTKQRSD